MVVAGTVFDDGDIALFIAVAAGVVLLVLAVIFMLGWIGGRTLGGK